MYNEPKEEKEEDINKKIKELEKKLLNDEEIEINTNKIFKYFSCNNIEDEYIEENAKLINDENIEEITDRVYEFLKKVNEGKITFLIDNFREGRKYNLLKSRYGENDKRTEQAKLELAKCFYDEKELNQCLNFIKPLYIKYKEQEDNKYTAEIKYYYTMCIYRERKYAEKNFDIIWNKEEKQKLTNLLEKTYHRCVDLFGIKDIITMKIKYVLDLYKGKKEKICKKSKEWVYGNGEILKGIDDSEYKISQNKAFEIANLNKNLKSDFLRNTRDYISFLSFKKFATDIVNINSKKYWNVKIYEADFSKIEEDTYGTKFIDGCYIFNEAKEELNKMSCIIDVDTGEYQYYPL